MASQESSPEAPVLVLAGVHDNRSLPWAAAEQWLGRHEGNTVLATVTSEKRARVVSKQAEEYGNRVAIVPEIDWTDLEAAEKLRAILDDITNGERVVSGVVHGIAKAGLENFTHPAHEIPAQVYVDAFHVSAASLASVIQGSRDFVVDNGGYVAYGFTEHGHTVGGYGPALSLAKNALTGMIVHTGQSMQKEDPRARIVEIRAPFIPTNSSKAAVRGSGGDAGGVAANFHETSPLLPADLEGLEDVRQAVGEMTASYVDPRGQFRYVTGTTIESDAGWHHVGRNIAPEKAEE